MTTLKLLVIGDGRMGRSVRAAAQNRGHHVVDVWGRAELDSVADRRDVFESTDVAIDFTHESIVEAVGTACLESGTALVSGTTDCIEQIDRLRRLASSVGVGFLWAPNFSLGVQLTFRLVRDAARSLGAAGMSPFLVEEHHAGKVDAPSGTARRLAEILVEQTPGARRYGPAPERGRIDPEAVSVSWVRAGDVPGTHRVAWDGRYETIEIKHTARSRDLFADGAVTAAEWLNTQDGPRDVDQWIDGLIRQSESEKEGGK